MISKVSNEYLSTRAWLRDVVNGDNLILRGVSALEYLELFVGYVNEMKIEVYATEKGIYENIDYAVTNNFERIDFTRFGSLLCCTVNQAINDMLSDIENIDELALIEALSNYYYEHNNSFEELDILPSNITEFERIKEYAVNYYTGG